MSRYRYVYIYIYICLDIFSYVITRMHTHTHRSMYVNILCIDLYHMSLSDCVRKTSMPGPNDGTSWAAGTKGGAT